MAKNTDNENVRKTVNMLLSIAFQLFILENPIIPTKKVPSVKTSKTNKGWKYIVFIIDSFILGDHTSRYKKNKATQTNEKIKDQKFIVCFMITPLLIWWFLLNFSKL